MNTRHSDETPKVNRQNSTASRHSNLPAETVEYLKRWIMSPEHIAHPYPTDQEKTQIMEDTGIELKQLTNWFVNNRKRYWKPRVEAAAKQMNLSLGGKPASRGMSLAQFLPPVVAPVSEDILHLQQPAALPTHSVVSMDSSVGGDELSCDGNTTDGEQAHLYDENSLYHKDTYDEETRLITRQEFVDVYILQSSDDPHCMPQIKDVTILSKLQQKKKVLKSYMNCEINYSFHYKNIKNRKKVQSRRDAEIVRVKKSYLKIYLAEIQLSKRKQQQLVQAPPAHRVPSCDNSLNFGDRNSSPTNITYPYVSPGLLSMKEDGKNSNICAQKGSIVDPSKMIISTTESSSSYYINRLKRSFHLSPAVPSMNVIANVSTGTTTTEAALTKRFKASTASKISFTRQANPRQSYLDKNWKEKCQKAKDGYDSALPTLEEAAVMFGFGKILF